MFKVLTTATTFGRNTRLDYM